MLSFPCANRDAHIQKDPITIGNVADAVLADDLLRGVKAIAEYIGETPRKTYYLLENQRIPAGKIGSTWIASKTRLRAHFERITGGGQ